MKAPRLPTSWTSRSMLPSMQSAPTCMNRVIKCISSASTRDILRFIIAILLVAILYFVLYTRCASKLESFHDIFPLTLTYADHATADEMRLQQSSGSYMVLVESVTRPYAHMNFQVSVPYIAHRIATDVRVALHKQLRLLAIEVYAQKKQVAIVPAYLLGVFVNIVAVVGESIFTTDNGFLTNVYVKGTLDVDNRFADSGYERDEFLCQNSKGDDRYWPSSRFHQIILYADQLESPVVIDGEDAIRWQHIVDVMHAKYTCGQTFDYIPPFAFKRPE